MITDVVVDLSHWQAGPGGGPNDPIDFTAMRAGGVVAVILKATQGSNWIDGTFVGRAIAAHLAGLLVGAYHFCDASSPTTQASHFLSLARSLPRLAIDVEPNGIGTTASVAQAAEVAALVHQAVGKLPAAYIGRWGPTRDGAGLPNPVLARCPLWLSEYGSNPVPPLGWTTWTLWQHTETGACPGVAGHVDRSYFNGTTDALVAWWGS